MFEVLSNGDQYETTQYFRLITAPCSAICLLACLAINIVAKEFEGIIPLRSTRAMVEKRWGNPDAKGGYQLEGKYIEVTYSTGKCGNEIDCECLVDKDVVIEIEVTFQREIKLRDMKIDVGKYTKTKDSHLLVYDYYSNDEEGAFYTVFREDKTVQNARFYPSKKDCELLTKAKKQGYKY